MKYKNDDLDLSPSDESDNDSDRDSDNETNNESDNGESGE